MMFKMHAASVLILVLLCGSVHPQQVILTPQELVVREGEPFQFVCKVGSRRLDSCQIETPDGRSYLPKSGSPGVNLKYFGGGFEAGECGVTVDGSESSQDGLWKCSLRSSESNETFVGNISVIIAKAELILAPNYSQDNEYNEGEVLKATCRVRNKGPATNITWFIGDDLISSGLVTSERPGLSTVVQNVSHTISWLDHGKKLRCVARQVAEREGMAAETSVRVRFGPKATNFSIELFGFKLGEEGLVSVNVSAHPKPKFTWTVDCQDYSEGQRIGQYEAEEARMIESGMWEALLRIKKVSSTDFGKNFILMARNELGTCSYSTIISSIPVEQKFTSSNTSNSGALVIIILLILTIILILTCLYLKRRGYSLRTALAYFINCREVQQIPAGPSRGSTCSLDVLNSRIRRRPDEGTWGLKNRPLSV